MYYDSLNTPFGLIYIAKNDNGLTHLCFKLSDIPESYSQNPIELGEYKQQLIEYFDGKRQQFTLPLAPKGTLFQQKVWQALCEIPFGQTRSYGEIAQAIGQPTASRAVGGANNANPIAIIIPCHRVIGSNGKLTGYAGGLGVKTFLLSLEQSKR